MTIAKTIHICIMTVNCKKCLNEITDARSSIKCGGFCSDTFCMKCCGLNDVILTAVADKSNLFWMCNPCKDIMEKARFRNALVSAESANQKLIEDLKNTLRSDILNELKLEIRANFKTLIDSVPKTPVPGSQTFAFNSAKRKRDTDDTASNRPSKLLRGTDIICPLSAPATNSGIRDDNKFWLYLSGISPDVPDDCVGKLVAEKLGTSDITTVKLVPRGKDPRVLNFVSFKLGMHMDLKTKAMTASTWPVGIVFREFVDKSEPRKVFWRPVVTNPVSTNSDGSCPQMPT